MTDTQTTPSGPNPGPTPDRSPRRWTRILLIASLGFNLVILGLFGGHELSRALHGPPPVRALGFGPFTQALSPADRRALMRDFMAQAKGFSEQRRQMRSDFRSLIEALKATPYDPARFAALMARQKTRTDEWMALGQSLLAERIAAMTPAERAAFAKRLETEVTRHREHEREREHRRPPPPQNPPAQQPPAQQPPAQQPPVQGN